MTGRTQNAEARPIFRKLALGTSIACLILGAILWFVVSGVESRLAETLLFVIAYVMAAIANTGRLPPMPSVPKVRDARPIFRRMALGVSIVCLSLALLFTFGDFGQGTMPAIICYFVGYVMMVIWQTGNWPSRK